ncbi:hypothetical protein D9M72_557030 [compost metagenome]
MVAALVVLAVFFAGAAFFTTFDTAVFLAGVRFFASRLFCSSDMKSTTLVVASCGAAGSSSTVVVPPFCLMRLVSTACRRSRNSSW